MSLSLGGNIQNTYCPCKRWPAAHRRLTTVLLPVIHWPTQAKQGLITGVVKCGIVYRSEDNFMQLSQALILIWININYSYWLWKIMCIEIPHFTDVRRFIWVPINMHIRLSCYVPQEDETQCCGRGWMRVCIYSDLLSKSSWHICPQIKAVRPGGVAPLPVVSDWRECYRSSPSSL